MVVTSAPAGQSQKLHDMLDLLAIQTETLLESLAGRSLLEARRQITRDLHFEPRAEELQTFVGIAVDESTGGPRYELPRRFLGLRLLADRQVKHVLETKMLKAETMRESGTMLGELVRAAQQLEADLDQAVSANEALNKNDRDFLLKVGDALSCNQDELRAASVLAHRLAELAEMLATGNLEEMEPSLSEEERDQIAAFAAENITQETCRAALDAVAIRSSVERLFNGWREFGNPSEDDESKRAQRDIVFARLKHAMIALESVSTRLQTQRDAALVAGIETLAEELRDAGRGLFSIKLQIAPILRDPYVDYDVVESCESDPAELIEQLGVSAAEEAEAEGGPRRETEQEIYLGALKDMQSRNEDQKEEARKHRKQTELERQRRRMKWMVAASVVLAITSAIVNFAILPGGGSKEPRAPRLETIPPVINVRGVDSAGPMMLTRVDGWNDLDENARRTRADRLGEIASENGFQMLMVVDEYGQGAAAWDQESGSGLPEEP